MRRKFREVLHRLISRPGFILVAQRFPHHSYHRNWIYTPFPRLPKDRKRSPRRRSGPESPPSRTPPLAPSAPHKLSDLHGTATQFGDSGAREILGDVTMAERFRCIPRLDGFTFEISFLTDRLAEAEWEADLAQRRLYGETISLAETRTDPGAPVSRLPPQRDIIATTHAVHGLTDSPIPKVRMRDGLDR